MSENLYLGIDTGGTAMKYALTDRQGHLVDEGAVPTRPHDPIASLEGLAAAVGDRLQMDWQIEELPRTVQIPLLTLQPLLENAIYHGIQPLPEGGTITLRLWLEQDSVNVEITNPLPPANARYQSQGNRMALNNIRSRLSVLYGSRAQLNTDAGDETYATTLRYPLNGGNEEIS